ncbi:NADP-dependent malic enzyme [Myxococcota bacterium]|nr:NADP-dependent malic enzyme [Myxococcota bacterium]
MSAHDDDRSKETEKHYATALIWHELCRGKQEIFPRCPVRGNADFSVWYTPGVAEPCRRIAADPALAYKYTNKGNTIAVLSDGSRVLGLGDIGPEAGLPVMEGKGLIFKMYGGVDAVALCVNAPTADELVAVGRAVAPSFGGINLEDIASPRCFDVLDRLRAELDIPVWHDDRQGTATVIFAGLRNAARVTGRRLEDCRFVLLGAGAANLAVAELLAFSGVDPGQIIFVDRPGILGPEHAPYHPLRDGLVARSNSERRTGGLTEALAGADVLVALSTPGPGIITKEQVRSMAGEAIVFACANPVPEIWPWEAADAGAAVVATGRGDFPNQVNNALIFPGVFRGALDVQARTISQAMCIAAADALAGIAVQAGLRADRILPAIDDPAVAPAVAAGVGVTAIVEGLARIQLSRDELMEKAKKSCNRSAQIMTILMREKILPELT